MRHFEHKPVFVPSVLAWETPKLSSMEFSIGPPSLVQPLEIDVLVLGDEVQFGYY